MNQKYNNDPLLEDKHEVIKGLIWKYGTRVLFELTLSCDSYCCYCCRIRKVGAGKQYYLSKKEIDLIIDYIAINKDINEVIISGGDPLIVPDYLEYVLKKLNNLKNVTVIRIHTKAYWLAKNNWLRLIKKQRQPIYICIHFNKATEIDAKSLNKLRKAGAILLSQSVFIKGLNDNVEVLAKLFTKLLENGVKPYYIYHCDDVKGLEKFQISIEKETEILKEVKKKISGLALPLHVVDTATEKIIVF